MDQRPHPLARQIKPVLHYLDAEVPVFYTYIGKLLRNHFSEYTHVNLTLRLFNNFKCVEIFTFNPKTGVHNFYM